MAIKTDVNIKRLFDIDEWTLTENKLPDNSYDIRLSESITSLGNEYMGMRGNFEEKFGGDSHQGSYIGGIWYPDKTVVGWWKNGYPNYFGKAINAINHIGLNIFINEVELDLNEQTPKTYQRTLDMYNGTLMRKFTTTVGGVSIDVEAKRFVSLAVKELCAIEYTITPSQNTTIEVDSFLYGDVINRDANYKERFWTHVSSKATNNQQQIHSKLKANNFGIENFEICASSFLKTNLKPQTSSTEEQDLFASTVQSFKVKANEKLVINKYIVVSNSLNAAPKDLQKVSQKLLDQVKEKEFSVLETEHSKMWHERWKNQM
ncbi:glycosyl hydrolase, family 65 (trehalase) [Spiroplasma clarkii]|nr:hypothetical protein [Spiroplasma clarkii]ARU90946.1 glycosyl hydrolase, family 65 (trehalase) [Spiroplasma clarkii]